MKKEISKKKLGFKKTFVANLDQYEAGQLLGGDGTEATEANCENSATCPTKVNCPRETGFIVVDIIQGA